MTVLLELDRSEIRPQLASTDGARALERIRERLDAGWCILSGRRVAAGGGTCTLDAIVLHPGYGLGLVAVRPEEFTAPELAVRTVRAFLLERGFDTGFPGYLPVVFVSVDPAMPQDAPKRLAAAFAAVPPLGVADARWLDAAADLFAAASIEEAEAVYDLDAEAAPGGRESGRPPALLRPLLVAGSLVALGFTGFAATTIALSPEAPRGPRHEAASAEVRATPERAWEASLLPAPAAMASVAAETAAPTAAPAAEPDVPRPEPILVSAVPAAAAPSLAASEPPPPSPEPVPAESGAAMVPPDAAAPLPESKAEPKTAAAEPAPAPTAPRLAPAAPAPQHLARAERHAARAAARKPAFRGVVPDESEGRHDPASAFLESPVAIRLGGQLKGRMDLSLERRFKSDDGLFCRDYRQSVTLEGQRHLSSAGTVCRQRSGRWVLVP